MATGKRGDLKTGQSLDQIIANAKKTQDLHIGSLSTVADDVEAISTGNIAIDYIIGVGGLPIGRCIECYGPPSSGKTTTALQAAAALQKLIIAGGNTDPKLGPLCSADDVIVYADYEQAMDPKYCKDLGLDLDHPSFLFMQPDFLEQGANVLRQMIETGRVRLMIVDSVAAMTPEAALLAETGKASVALQARLMSDFLKPLIGALKQNRCTAVFINHMAEVIDMGGGGRPGVKRYTTPGGRALKFYASVRLEYQQIGNIKGDVMDKLSNEELEVVVATNVRVRVIKNKVAPPFRQAIVRVRYGKGFDNFWTALQILIAHKKITYSSGYYYFEKSPELVHEDMARQTSGNKRPYLRTEDTVFEFADEHPAWRDQMIAAARAVVQQDESALEAIVETNAEGADEEEADEAKHAQDLEDESPSTTPTLIGTTEDLLAGL